MRRNALPLLGVLMTLGICGLLLRLAFLQASSGTDFPPFSSLRADAQGTKAMFDVAEAVGRRVVRSYMPASELALKNTTIVQLGWSPEALARASLPVRDNPALLGARGNTVVLGLTGDCHYAQIKEWQLTMQCGDKGQYLIAPGWSASTYVDDQPVVVERKFGTGEIVVIANSRWLTNAGLARRSHPVLLASVLERRPTILFDEQRLGVTEASSVGQLLRTYRLHGVAAAVLLLFAVFVWKNASSFLPRMDSLPEEVAGRDTTTGLANLLRRSVPTSGVLDVAATEWAKLAKDPSAEAEIRRIIGTHRDPVEAYNSVAGVVHRKRKLV